MIGPNQQRLYFDDDKINNLLDAHKLLQYKLSNNLIPSQPTNHCKQVQPQIENKDEQSNSCPLPRLKFKMFSEYKKFKEKFKRECSSLFFYGDQKI